MLTNVSLGEAVTWPKLPVDVLPLKEVFAGLSDGEASPIDGILGTDVLDKCGAIIDVAANRLYLTTAAAAVSEDKPTATLKPDVMQQAIMMLAKSGDAEAVKALEEARANDGKLSLTLDEVNEFVARAKAQGLIKADAQPASAGGGENDMRFVFEALQKLAQNCDEEAKTKLAAVQTTGKLPLTMDEVKMFVDRARKQGLIQPAGVSRSLPVSGADSGGLKEIPGHVVIPVEVDDKLRFLLGGKVNGHEVRFALDSGADSSIFHQPRAAELEVELTQGTGTAKGPDGKPLATATGKVESIELPGGIRIQNQSFPFLDLGGFADTAIRGKPVHIDGLLGQGFIVGARMILDCGERRMLVPTQGANPGEFVSALEKQGGKVVKLLRGDNGKSYIPLSLDGEKVALLIDTGASLSTLEPGYVNDKTWKRSKSASTVQTLGKTAELETVTVPLTQFGPCQVPNISYALVPHAGRRFEPEVGGRKVVGILGMNTLMPLRLVLDFGGNQVLFPINKLKAISNPPTAAREISSSPANHD